MKKLFLLLTFYCLKTTGQINLIKNPSFETYTTCPNSSGLIYLSSEWWYAMNTPDYYNSCSSPTIGYSIPNNQYGRQHAKTGNAYAGIYVWTVKTSLEYREYIRGQLTQSLTVGTKYYLSFKVSIAEQFGIDDVGNPIASFLPCNKIGLKFITKPVFVGTNTVSYSLMNNQAHLYSQTIVSDTSNWTTIQGSFIADSAYSYVMIGNFFDNAHTDTLARKGSMYVSYYYVDDIMVSTDSTIIDYTLGMAESSYNNKLLLYPNPAKDKLNLVFESTQAMQKNKALFYNLLGELIYEKPLTEPNTEIDIGFLKRGLYYVKVQNAVAKVLVE